MPNFADYINCDVIYINATSSGWISVDDIGSFTISPISEEQLEKERQEQEDRENYPLFFLKEDII